MLIGPPELETTTSGSHTTKYDPLARSGCTDLTYPAVFDDKSELFAITV